MEKNSVEEIVADVKLRLERAQFPIPAGVSNRHVHLTGENFKTLFGRNPEPSVLKHIGQPGQFACNETVAIETQKGSFKNVRMIGPCRSYTQVEISSGDAKILGIEPPIRDSGKIENSPGIKITGRKGSIVIPKGVIISKRHIHFSVSDAKKFKVLDGTEVRVRCGAGGERETVFEKTLCRVSKDYALEFHVDIEEANAAGLKNGDMVYIV
ncbi:MAG: phosphate propanoyltransferase [Elusimicrobia bacterium]|nr:phosphate propanoyltransferase [Elusimicrobiota bacterium]